MLVILGNRTAQEVYEAATLGYADQFARIEQVYFEESSFVDRLVPEYHAAGRTVYFHVGIADAMTKWQIVRRCHAVGWLPFTVVHPTAVISSSARLGDGVFAGPLSVISANAIVGDHSIVHIHASIGHDAAVGQCCCVLPGARISGSVQIGDRVLVGSNAFVAPGVSLGDDSQVDALTYVRHDLPAKHLASSRSKQIVPRLNF